MRTAAALTMLALSSAIPVFGAGPFQDIIKGVEPGKRFHPISPAVVGQPLLGVMVEAKKPKRLMALFETIESPAFRNPTYNGDFEVGQTEYAAPELTGNKELTMNIAFDQLDAIATALSQAPAAAERAAPNLLPSVPVSAQPALAASQASPANQNTSTDTGQSGGQSASTSAPSPGQGVDASNNNTQERVTGVDFSSVQTVHRKIGKIVVEFYTLSTLKKLEQGVAINRDGLEWLDSANNGWVIHRTLSARDVDYTFTANADLSAGFFAKLSKWIPGMSVRYVNNRTFVLRVPGPIYIGYKLWRPGVGTAGASADSIDIHAAGIGADDIEQLLQPLAN